MERFDIEQPGWRPSSTVYKLTNAATTSRFISIKKYSTAICLVEALTIAFLVYLLFRLPPPPNDLLGPNRPGNVSNSNQPYRIYYSSKQGLSVTVLPGLVPGCNQRRHDFSFSRQCKSSQIKECGRPHSWDIEGMTLAKRLQKIGDPSIVEVVTTSKSGLRMKNRLHDLKKITCRKSETGHATSNKVEHAARCRLGTRIELDHSQLHQKIIGWGGALTDSSIQNILSLTVNGTRRLLDDYFGQDGLLFNIVRVTIGGSDFSARFYTNDDYEDHNLPEEAKLLKGFRLNEEDYLYKIPMLRMIQREYDRGEELGNPMLQRPIKLFASMWSPPVWMKTNLHFNKGQLRGSISPPNTGSQEFRPEETFYEALADLKMKWLSSYQKEKVNFWGLTVMNEPIFAVQPFLNFNTMIFPPDDYKNYILKYLGPKLKQSKAMKHIKLMVHDDNRRFLMNYTKPLLDDDKVRRFVDGVSVHGYIDEEYPLMDYMYETYKEKHRQTSSDLNNRQPDDWFVLPTELCSGHLPFMEKALVGNWHRGIHYALDIIHSLQHSAAGWVDWNMVLDTEGGAGWLGGRLDAPIIVDKQRDLYHKSPMFYVLGQFSRFISPGSQRIETRVINDLYDNQFEVVSFKVDNGNWSGHKVATVIVNNNPYKIEVLLQVGETEANKLEGETRNYHPIECPPDSVITVLHN